jgi:hypothetical protein
MMSGSRSRPISVPPPPPQVYDSDEKPIELKIDLAINPTA